MCQHFSVLVPARRFILVLRCKVLWYIYSENGLCVRRQEETKVA